MTLAVPFGGIKTLKSIFCKINKITLFCHSPLDKEKHTDRTSSAQRATEKKLTFTQQSF
jgi:hypothetical protein